MNRIKDIDQSAESGTNVTPNLINSMKSTHTLTLLASAAILSACGSDSSPATSNGTNLATGTNDGMAVLTVELVDAPVDQAAHVYVNISGLELQGPQQRHSFAYCLDDTPVTIDASDTSPTDTTSNETTEVSMKENSPSAANCTETEIRTIDLLTLTEGSAASLLDDVVIPAGPYSWIRLQLADNPGILVLEDGTEHDLVIPSGTQTGLKLNGGFEAHDNASNHLVLDFDLRKSVVQAGNKYLLKPVIKMIRIDEPESQALSGSWSITDAEGCTTPMAYLFEGADVVPDDIDGDDIDPVVSVAMSMSADGTGWDWNAPWLESGAYTVAYVCDGSIDDPEADDQLDFKQQFNRSIDTDK